jgi:SAM-dependent methyltransferase
MTEGALMETWKKDSQSFDTVAGQYDEFRPEYPEELVDSIIKLSGIEKAGWILEVGCGTGKATRLFARLGYRMHCIEPGRNLSAVAQHNLQEYPGITFEASRFEDSQDCVSQYDLAISAQAFHWVPKEVGYAKIARSLKPGGALALFWNMYPGFHGQIDTELDKIYHAVAPGLANPRTDSEEIIQERRQDIIQSGYFGQVVIERFPWSQSYTTRQYTGLLNTYSDHLRLPAETRQRLYKAVAAAIEAQGGSVVRNYVAVLYAAHKLSQ